MNGSTFWTYEELELIEAAKLRKAKIDRGDIDVSITGKPLGKWKEPDECEDWDEECRKSLHGQKRKK